MTTAVNAKTVTEYPMLFDEELVPLCRAGELFPVPVSRQTVERLWRRGQRGILLKTVFFASKRYTSVEEIARFLQSTQNSGEAPTAEVRSVMSSKQLAEKSRRFGLPKPGEKSTPAQK